MPVLKVGDIIRSPDEVPQLAYVACEDGDWWGNEGISRDDALGLLQRCGWRIVSSGEQEAIIKRQSRKIANLRSNLRGVLKSLKMAEQLSKIRLEHIVRLHNQVLERQKSRSIECAMTGNIVTDTHWLTEFVMNNSGVLLFIAGLIVGILAK